MRRLTFTLAAVIAVTETYRRGYTAPLLLGVRLWCSARPARYFEADIIG